MTLVSAQMHRRTRRPGLIDAVLMNMYTYSVPITIQSSKVAADHVDFPILVSGIFDGTNGEADLRTVSNGGNIQNVDANGGASGAYIVPADFMFSPNADGSDKFDFEFQRYNAATGEIIAWVKIPTMDADADLTLYMIYGNAGVSVSQENVTGTWNANYDMVLHTEGAAWAELIDSTGNGNDVSGIIGNPIYQQAGKIGYAVDFDGSGDTLKTLYSNDWDTTKTITWLCQIDSLAANAYSMIGSINGNWVDYGLLLHRNDQGGIVAQFGDPGATFTTPSIDMVVNPAWNHMVFQHNLDTFRTRFHQGGVEITDEIHSKQNFSGSGILGIGGDTKGGNVFNGRIEEIRVLSVEVGDDWITTEYNNHHDVDTFLAFGVEAYVVATGGTITFDGLYKIHTFTEDDDFIVTSGGRVESLVAAGGGGGGNWGGGGGGAGGLLIDVDHGVSSQTYGIIVGDGGAGSVDDAVKGEKGSDSIFDDMEAEGGGGGGSNTGAKPGVDGGSGGGGAPNLGAGGIGTGGQGNNGGVAGNGSPWQGGGGGGASAVGEAGDNGGAGAGGDGGVGTESSIDGSTETYAGGGGGGQSLAGAGGAGGVGGGGAGGGGTNPGSNGSVNTGGGGGGGGGSQNGGNGGSGIVIIRYLTQ